MKKTLGMTMIVILLNAFSTGCKNEEEDDFERLEQEYNKRINDSIKYMREFEGTCNGIRRARTFYNGYLRDIDLEPLNPEEIGTRATNDSIKPCEKNLYIEIDKSRLTDDDIKIMNVFNNWGSEQIKLDKIATIDREKICFKVYKLECICIAKPEKLDTECEPAGEFQWCLPWLPRDPRNDQF